jgi:chromosomal replication initiation ATPase DnaA
MEKRKLLGDPEIIILVAKAVKDVTGIGMGKLRTKTRKPEILEARQIAMTLVMETGLLSKSFVGRYFKMTHHMVVGNAVQRVNDLCDTEWRFKNKVDKIRGLVVERLPSMNTYSKNLEVFNEVKSFL